MADGDAIRPLAECYRIGYGKRRVIHHGWAYSVVVSQVDGQVRLYFQVIDSERSRIVKVPQTRMRCSCCLSTVTFDPITRSLSCDDTNRAGKVFDPQPGERSVPPMPGCRLIVLPQETGEAMAREASNYETEPA